MNGIAVAERAKTAIALGESHFREFKSGLQGIPGEKVKRSIKSIGADIAETLVAFANADGGELLVGVEDSGEISGLNRFSEKEIEKLTQAPAARIHDATPLPTVKTHRMKLGDYLVLYFAVPKSTKFVHITSDGRCLQRSDLESVPVASEIIQFDRKEELSREFDRHFVDGVSAEDLNLDLVKVVADQLVKGMSPEKCLQYLELAEYGMSQLRLRKAALLLFAKEPARWHPRLQIRIMKVDGSEIRTGEDYNVVSDNTVSGNIIELVDAAWESLRPNLVHTKFDASGRFAQKSIYPELACKEALLNSIAHRNYADEGRGVEVFIFDDHLEINNPGGLLSTIRIEDISNQTGAHQSRNTYIARVLRELGYMRELGEGMRRIYELMHKNELAAPILSSEADSFSITLTHRPIYSDKDLLWLNQFEQFDLDREQKAIVLLGQDEGVFSAQDVWEAVGIVDTEHYRFLVDWLIKKKILISKIERNKAKRIARNKKIPFREFPRYCVLPPGLEADAASGLDTEFDESDIRDRRKKLFVGNIPRDVTEEEIFEAFGPYGSIDEIIVPRRGKQSRGFCFVEMESLDSAEKALADKNRVMIRDRKAYVRAAINRQPKP